MIRPASIALLVAFAIPATLHAQSRDAREAQDLAPAELAPQAADTCDVTVQIDASARADDGTLPLRGWTHVTVGHQRSAEGATVTDTQVNEALRALDVNGDGALDEGELEGHLEGDTSGRSLTVRLPSQCRPDARL